jgi:hypothetical protein
MDRMRLPLLGAVRGCWLVGCAVTAPILPAAASKLSFDRAVYKGTNVKVHEATPGREAHCVFQQGATGFVSIQSVRDDAEQRANDFCECKTGGVMESLTRLAHPRLYKCISVTRRVAGLAHRSLERGLRTISARTPRLIYH